MTQPRIFIASSVEGKDLADALEIALQHDGVCTAWHEAFPLASNTIDTLLQRCAENDFAIFVFSPDDQITIRKDKYEVARDNVLFEAGLFMGMHGKDRGFIVTPLQNSAFHIPTDMLGLTTAKYDHKRAQTEPSPALGAAAAQIRQAIKRSPFAQRHLELYVRAQPLTANLTYPLKVTFTITNNQNAPVAIEAKGFTCADSLAVDPKTGVRVGDKYRYSFFIGKDAKDSSKDKYETSCTLDPGQSISSWIPLEPTIESKAIEQAVAARTTGVLHYRVTWLTVTPTAQDYQDAI